MNGRFLRWISLAAVLSVAACGGDDAARDAGATADETGAAAGDAPADPPPTVDVSGKAPPEPEPAGPTPIVRSKVERPSRSSPAGQRYTDCIAKARAAPEAERAILESTCARLPDAPKD